MLTKCPECGGDCCEPWFPTPANEIENPVEEEKSKSLDNLATALMITGGLMAVPCIGAALFGFGAAGIVGGSFAAGVQSGIGNVAAGSAFATLQSLGATGTFVTGASYGGAAAGAGAVGKLVSKFTRGDEASREYTTNNSAGAGAEYKRWKDKGNKSDGNTEQNENETGDETENETDDEIDEIGMSM